MEIIVQTCVDYLASVHLDPVSAVAGGTAWAVARWVLLLILNLMRTPELSPIAKDILSQLDHNFGWRLSENGFLSREAVRINDRCIVVAGKDAGEFMPRRERKLIHKRADKIIRVLEDAARQTEKDKILRALGNPEAV